MGNMNEVDSGPIGQSLRRREDRRFLTGDGQYTDDLTLHRQTYACFLRSPHAHARIRSIKLDAAKKAPGVVAIFTGADLAAGKVGGLPCGWLIHSKDGSPMKEPPHPVITADKVRHVGDQVALVIAESYLEAKDAAELIEVDYDVLPAVVDVTKVESASPPVHDEVPNNVCYDWGHGDKAAVDAAFAKAAHVTRLDFTNNRLIPNAMEPRAVNASFNKSDQSYTLYVANQNPHVERLLMCAFVLGLPESKVRVIAPDVGGGFGSKIYLYPEDVALVWASKQVGRPIKWTAERSESFLTDAHGRDHVTHRGAGDRRARQLPGAAREDDRQHGRLSLDLRHGGTDHPLRDAARRSVQDAGDLCRGQVGVHEHRAGRRLSRCRPAGGDLPRRAHRRAVRARPEARPGRAAPPELHHQLPVRDTGRPYLRRRQLRGASRQGDRDGRRGRFSRRARPRRRRRARSAASAIPATSRPAVSRHRTSPAPSARAPACSSRARSASIRPAR